MAHEHLPQLRADQPDRQPQRGRRSGWRWRSGATLEREIEFAGAPFHVYRHPEQTGGI
jgi:hypothetical protein